MVVGRGGDADSEAGVSTELRSTMRASGGTGSGGGRPSDIGLSSINMGDG